MQLIVRHPGSAELRYALAIDAVVRIGRTPPSGLAVSGDPAISREHAELRRSADAVTVRRLPSGRNPIFFRGAESDAFTMAVGEHFVIGQTRFLLQSLTAGPASDEPTPAVMLGFTLAELRQIRYHNAEERLEVLAHLPHVLEGAADDRDLFSRLVLMLLEGIPGAKAAAVVELHSVEGDTEVEVHQSDVRGVATTRFVPSRRLVLDALLLRRQSVCSIWKRGLAAVVDYTLEVEDDWAFCCPVPEGRQAQPARLSGGRTRDAAASGAAPMFTLGLYVAGHSAAHPDLRPEIKFTELVAHVLGAVRHVQQLQRHQATLGRFFSPRALPVLASAEGEKALAPRETPVAVLFCDLRGFSRQAEQARDDLIGLLRRVSHALDVMTEAIHLHHGVIGDFQGDAALAFWGWPLAEEDLIAAACRAALDIRARFAQAAKRSADPLSEFRCGIGIASGSAVAGLLGTTGQAKIGVFGPVVNLASRLEGLTKSLQVPILLDEVTAQHLDRLSPAWGRLRRLAKVRPHGLDQAVVVSELLPPAGAPEILSDEDLESYRLAFEAFRAGHWDEAYALLHRVPPWDTGKDFLISHITQHQRKPPAGWAGVIGLETK